MKPDMLTASERRVLALVAAGLSNRQIAAETGYTLSTVGYLVSNAVKKSGGANRTDAALRWHGVNMDAALHVGRGGTQHAPLRSDYVELDELRARVAYLEATLAPVIITPTEWKLTRTESVIIAVLAGREIASREAMHAALYSLDPNGGADMKVIDVYIHHLRKKLKPFGFRITTCFGRGFSLAKEAQALVRRVPEPYTPLAALE